LALSPGEDSDLAGNQTVDGVLLTDVQFKCWSSTAFSDDQVKNAAWAFAFLFGTHGGNFKNNIFYGWAVRAGDVGAVPVPAAVWLFGSGLLGLIGVARRKNPHINATR
jgi:hypothetical protein